jgi:hypothetical protein
VIIKITFKLIPDNKLKTSRLKKGMNEKEINKPAVIRAT